eukprot:3467841-Amphidinium_carterae.1
MHIVSAAIWRKMQRSSLMHCLLGIVLLGKTSASTWGAQWSGAFPVVPGNETHNGLIIPTHLCAESDMVVVEAAFHTERECECMWLARVKFYVDGMDVV